MTTENLREMTRYSRKRLFVASSGQGRAMTAAGAPCSAIPAHCIPALGSASNPRKRTVPPFTVRTDRRDRTTLRAASAITPPSHRSYSSYVPFSPWCPVISHNIKVSITLKGPGVYHNHSNHITVTVDLDSSTVNNCARADGTTIRGIPGTDSYLHTGRSPLCSATNDHRSLSCTHSWKGTLP